MLRCRLPAARGQRPTLQCRAKPPDLDGSATDEDARIEAMESSGRRNRAASVGVRGLDDEDESKQVEWKDGKLVPEGWERMSTAEKAGQLYVGERGLLFWMNKLAYASVFVMGGLWVLFRFVGPGIGLYDLAGGPPQQ